MCLLFVILEAFWSHVLHWHSSWHIASLCNWLSGGAVMSVHLLLCVCWCRQWKLSVTARLVKLPRNRRKKPSCHELKSTKKTSTCLSVQKNWFNTFIFFSCSLLLFIWSPLQLLFLEWWSLLLTELTLLDFHVPLLMCDLLCVLELPYLPDRKPQPVRAGFSFFQLTNQLANCQLALTGELSLHAFLNSSVT